MSHTIQVASPAKINLFLHIHQQRPDGYHELKTYFQLVDLCDTINLTPDNSGAIRVDNPTLSIPQHTDLCYLAAQALQAFCKTPRGVSIRVDKRIPDGGGLGGGSSNAATVLRVLNRLWETHLPETTLLQIGLSLGADVPIFLHGNSSYAEGRGEKFSPHMPNNILENQIIVIIKSKVHAATAQIFQSPSLTKRPEAGKIRDLDTVCYQNDFESVVYALYPDISQAAQRLSAYSAAHLTGTGACLYTVLDDVKKADKISRALSCDYKVFITKPLSTSPLNEFK